MSAVTTKKVFWLGIGATLLIAALAAAYIPPRNDSRTSNQPFATNSEPPRQSHRELLLPADSSLDKLVVTVVFAPEKRDPTYDYLERTGGQNFHLQSSELEKAADLMLATSDPNGQLILGAQGSFSGTSRRLIELAEPKGETVTAASMASSSKIIEWSAGKAYIVSQPTPGIWKLTLQGSGRYSVRALARVPSSGPDNIILLDFDFIKLQFGREGWSYFPFTDIRPAMGAEYLAEIEVSEDAETTPAPRLVLKNEEGREIATNDLRVWQRGDFGSFGAVFRIPREPFRVGIRGADKNGFAYERYVSGVIEPEQKPSPYLAEDIQRFKTNPDEE